MFQWNIMTKREGATCEALSITSDSLNFTSEALTSKIDNMVNILIKPIAYLNGQVSKMKSQVEQLNEITTSVEPLKHSGESLDEIQIKLRCATLQIERVMPYMEEQLSEMRTAMLCINSGLEAKEQVADEIKQLI